MIARNNRPVIIVGGGPAGMMAGLLLARAGVLTVVLEKHRDFLRDFRGDTVHPSMLGIFLEQQKAYGLLNACVGWASDNGRYGIALVGRNLLDKNHVVSTASYTAAISGRPGTPRTVDVTFTVNW